MVQDNRVNRVGMAWSDPGVTGNFAFWTDVPHVGDRRPQLIATEAGIVVLTRQLQRSQPRTFTDAVILPELTMILVRMVGERTERWFYKFDQSSFWGPTVRLIRTLRTIILRTLLGSGPDKCKFSAPTHVASSTSTVSYDKIRES